MVSGTLAVFREEIDWLIYPQMRAVPGLERVGLDQIVAAVREALSCDGFFWPVPAQAEGPRSALGVVDGVAMRRASAGSGWTPIAARCWARPLS